MGIAADRYDWFIDRVRTGTFDEAAAVDGFTPSFLEAVPAQQLVAFVTGAAEIVTTPEAGRHERGDALLVSYGAMEAAVNVERESPHRFRGLVIRPVRNELDDERLVDAPWVADGAGAPLDALQNAYRANGLVGVVAGAYGGDGAIPRWRIAGGYADLDAGRAVELDTRMLAGSISKLFTAVTALTLVASGDLDLHGSANAYLQSLKLASDDVTVFQLLTHTAGVSSAFEHYLEVAPPAVDMLGSVVALDFEPGDRREYSNGGYTVLGEVIAGVTGKPVVDAICETVLVPLGMEASTFAESWPADVGPGYRNEDGRAVEMERLVPSVPSAGGLVATVDDLARFVAGWRTLLPADLARDAMTQRVARAEGGGQGYGWIVGEESVGHAGGTHTYSSSLLWRVSDGFVSVMITNTDFSAVEALSASLRPPS